MEAPVRQESSSTESAWISSDTRGFNEARRTQKPVLIDFTAEWCAACRELDEKTWPDATVRHETERFVLVKLDLTKNNDRTRDLQQTYKILGMPTIILFTPEGEEMFRFEGFWSAEEMVSILRKYGQ